jgi:hypothetical protein
VITVALSLTCYLFLGSDIVENYTTNILPRLIQNEILEPFHYSNQSLHSFLLNLFVFDPYQNPSPIFDGPFIVYVLETFVLAFILQALVNFGKKDKSILLFSLILLSSLLFTKYSASYSLILALPFLLISLQHINSPIKFAIILIIAFGINLPPGFFWNYPLPFKYIRLWTLLIAFLLLITQDKIVFNLKYFSAFFLCFFGISLFLHSSVQPSYFSFQNSKGALYDYDLSGDSLTIYSCYGESDIVEKFPLKGELREDPSLRVEENKLMYNNNVLYDEPSNKSKPRILNDTSILFLSDLKQGVGFYKLNIFSLKK